MSSVCCVPLGSRVRVLKLAPELAQARIQFSRWLGMLVACIRPPTSKCARAPCHRRPCLPPAGGHAVLHDVDERLHAAPLLHHDHAVGHLPAAVRWVRGCYSCTAGCLAFPDMQTSIDRGQAAGGPAAGRRLMPGPARPQRSHQSGAQHLLRLHPCATPPAAPPPPAAPHARVQRVLLHPRPAAPHARVQRRLLHPPPAAPQLSSSRRRPSRPTPRASWTPPCHASPTAPSTAWASPLPCTRSTPWGCCPRTCPTGSPPCGRPRCWSTRRATCCGSPRPAGCEVQSAGPASRRRVLRRQPPCTPNRLLEADWSCSREQLWHHGWDVATGCTACCHAEVPGKRLPLHHVSM